MSNDKIRKNLSKLVRRELKNADDDTHHLVIYLLQQVFKNERNIRERTVQNKMRANMRSEIEKIAENPR